MKKIVLCSFVLLQLLVLNSYGQFRLRLGPQIGLNFNIHTGSDLNESANGFGFVFGGQVDMGFTDVIGLVTNLQFYDNRSGSLTEESSNQYQTDNGIITSTVSNESSKSLAYFLIEPMLKLSIPQSGFYFVVGPGFGFNIEGSFEDDVTETLPQGYTFQETGTNKFTQKTKGSLKDLLARFELKLGAGYDINVGSGMYITPQVNFGYGITKVQEDVSWRILTIQGLVGFKFSLVR